MKFLSSYLPKTPPCLNGLSKLAESLIFFSSFFSPSLNYMISPKLPTIQSVGLSIGSFCIMVYLAHRGSVINRASPSRINYRK